jgi:serine/threonine protein kinase
MPNIPPDLEAFYIKVCQAKRPEDIFGTLDPINPNETIKRIYHSHMLACHPDHYAKTNPGAAIYASELLKKLNELRDGAVARVKGGTYGQLNAPTSSSGATEIKIKGKTYRVFQVLAEGDYAECRYAEVINQSGLVDDRVCLKIIKVPDDNELIKNEILVMKKVLHKSLPVFIDQFKTKEQQKAIVMREIDGADLVSIKGANPLGIPEYDLGWIMERCLSVLGFMHYNSILHCNIEPGNILVRPSDHNCFLIDFLFSVIIDPHKRGKFQVYTDGFTAPEALKKEPPSYASDMYALGKCFIYVAGGNLDNNWLPTHLHQALRDFILEFVTENPLHRKDDAWKAYHELQDIRRNFLKRTGFVESKIF